MNRSCIVTLCGSLLCACGDESSPTCPPGAVEADGICVELCIHDDDCKLGTICVDGTCGVGARPQVVAYAPTDGASGTTADAVVMLTFSTAMDPVATSRAFLLTSATGPVAGDASWNDTHLAMTFTPAEALVAGQTYEAQLLDTATSSTGIAFAARFAFTFSIYMPAAAVTAMAPVPGSVDVGIRPLISLTFSTPMEPTSLRMAAELLDAQQDPVQGVEQLSESNTVLTFVPGAPLAFGSLYEVRVHAAAQSALGARLSGAFSATFSTTHAADAEPPELTIDPVDITISTPDLDSYGSYTFTGTATDQVTAVQQVYVQVVPAGQTPTDAWLPARLTGDIWSYRWFPTIDDPRPEGTFALYARAVDKGANLTQTDSVFSADLAPPPVPIFSPLPPQATKWPNVELQLEGEAGASAEVLLDTIPVSGSPVLLDLTGLGRIILSLPSEKSYAIAVFVTDAEGNRNNTPLLHSLQRIPYDCLTAANGFPAAGAPILQLDDDGEGSLAVTYALEAGFLDDSFIEQDQEWNRGEESSLNVQGESAALLRYSDVLQPPSCAEVESATLRLRSHSTLNAAAEIEVFPLLVPWSESQVTWSNAANDTPWESPGALGDADVGASHGRVQIDQTPHPDHGIIDLSVLVRRWLSGTTPHHGLMLRNRGYHYVSFVSSDAQSDLPTLELRLREPD